MRKGKPKTESHKEKLRKLANARWADPAWRAKMVAAQPHYRRYPKHD